jgi:hypothetical protein
LDTIKITFFGIGCRIVKGQFDELTWSKFEVRAKTIESPIEEAFFDKSFFHAIKITEYNSWFDLGNRFQISGLLESYQSIIELRINNKQKLRILFTELLGKSFLFPLYQTSISTIDVSACQQGNLTIVEKEIGTISTYKFEADNFSFDKLNFTLNSVIIQKNLKYQIVSKIEYDGKELFSKKSDTLVKEQFAML